MEEISYEQIVAGLLLKFKKIDNIDFSLIIEDFKSKTKVNICGLWNKAENIGKYVKCEKNGTISLKDDITLDYVIKEENKTLSEKFLKIAGKEVCDYIDILNIEEYKLEKEKALKENKEKVLNEANVLLISDIQDEYDELIKYGFKNVDYFKSIIRADSYFAKHPEELEKYHIILKGNQNIRNCSFVEKAGLDRTISKLRNQKHILEPTLYRYNHSGYIELVTYLNDINNHRSWNTKELTYPDIFDRIVENMLINHTLEKLDLKDKKFMPIQDYINPNRLPLPTKKSDLKILYLDIKKVNDLTSRIIEELKLDVTFKEEDNFSLDYVKNHLGEYDIIIVSRTYLGNLLNMNIESTEQCKDTGRQLTLLVSYDDTYLGVNRDLGDGIRLNYRFGGNIAPSSDFNNKEFRFLKQQIEIDEKDEYHNEYNLRKYSQIKIILEASVNFYNEALIQMKKNSLCDLDFKTAEELEQDYIKVLENKEAIRKLELAPIRLFDNIRYSIVNYLNYRKNELINQIPEGLKITECKYGIKVENIYQGRTLCAIVFQKEYQHEYLRVFEIQTLTKKGILSSPQTIGVYTSEYDNFESIPNRPDEKQDNALVSIEKKINIALRPLNEEAWKCHLKKEATELKRIKIKKD